MKTSKQLTPRIYFGVSSVNTTFHARFLFIFAIWHIQNQKTIFHTCVDKAAIPVVEVLRLEPQDGEDDGAGEDGGGGVAGGDDVTVK